MVDPIDTEFEIADARGREMLGSAPRAVSVRYDPATARVALELANGCLYGFPAEVVQELQGSAPVDLAEVEIDGLGLNLHWPRLDVDLYVPALVAGLFSTRDWMRRELARAAGRTTSPAKAKAARANGAKGGRPRKSA